MVIRWWPREDERLRDYVLFLRNSPVKWLLISHLFDDKTPEQCENRWYELEDRRTAHLQWSIEEDEKLLKLAREMPTKFDQIAITLGRDKMACINRFESFIDELEHRAGTLPRIEEKLFRYSEVKPTQMDLSNIDIEELNKLSGLRGFDEVGESLGARRRDDRRYTALWQARRQKRLQQTNNQEKKI